MSKLMVKVELYTAGGQFVAEVYSLPYKFWPQAVWWGSRMFARENFREMSHPSETPPPYYECTPLPVYSGQDLDGLGIC